jgi:hypothetical protein
MPELKEGTTTEEVDNAIELVEPLTSSGMVLVQAEVVHILAEEVKRLRSYGQQFAKVEAQLRDEVSQLRGAHE